MRRVGRFGAAIHRPQGFTLFVQARVAAPRDAGRFRKGKACVLFGLDSFWMG